MVMVSLWLDDAPSIPTDAWVQEATYDDVVVGAGLTGLATGLLLARAGRRVAVVEARSVGAVATGNTTAKVSLLQGTHLSSISQHHSDTVVEAYVTGNLEGQQWIARFCDDHGVPVQRVPAYTYAQGTSGRSAIERERRVARRVGLDVTWLDGLDVPFPVEGAIGLADQVQLNPMDLLAALASELREHGGVLHEGVRVTGVNVGDPCQVSTTEGDVRCSTVVLATGIPILDRSLYFAKMSPQRSYCVAYEGVSPPEGMYLSADQPSRSVRWAARPDGSRALIVGGSGHAVGRSRSPRRHLDQLRSWAVEHFAGVRETHWWSAQDYAPVDHIPFVGPMPRGRGHVYVATGFDKWGMANAVASALRISADVLGGQMPWAEPLRHRITRPRALAQGVWLNAEVGALLAGGWVGSLMTGGNRPPAEGSGRIHRGVPKPVASSTVDGTTCSVSAVCTHLGGVLTWNDAERSWDCPLHGSRFAPDGSVLEGPATRPLPAAGLPGTGV